MIFSQFKNYKEIHLIILYIIRDKISFTAAIKDKKI